MLRSIMKRKSKNALRTAQTNQIRLRRMKAQRREVQAAIDDSRSDNSDYIDWLLESQKITWSPEEIYNPQSPPMTADRVRGIIYNILSENRDSSLIDLVLEEEPYWPLTPLPPIDSDNDTLVNLHGEIGKYITDQRKLVNDVINGVPESEAEEELDKLFRNFNSQEVHIVIQECIQKYRIPVGVVPPNNNIMAIDQNEREIEGDIENCNSETYVEETKAETSVVEESEAYSTEAYSTEAEVSSPGVELLADLQELRNIQQEIESRRPRPSTSPPYVGLLTWDEEDRERTVVAEIEE